MKRVTLFTLILGIATLIVAPAVQARVLSDDASGGNARVMSDDSASGNAKVLPADINSGSGTGSSVALRPDILGGDGYSAPVPLRTDVLGGTGKPSPSVTWLTNQLRRDAPTTVSPVSSRDSFTWDATLLTATILGAMLLTLASLTVTRRRHRLSF